MRVLIVNTGSTSVKLRLLGSDDALLGRCDFPVVDGTIPVDAMTGALEQLGAFDAVGHRVVHGGTVTGRRCGSTTLCCSSSRRWWNWLPAPAAGAGRDLRPAPHAAPWRAAGGVLRHYVPHHRAGGGGHLCAACLVAGPVPVAPLRVPRLVARVCVPAGRRTGGGRPGPGGDRPSGRGCRPWPAVRHGQCVDTTMGFTPVGGPGDGHPSRDVDPGPRCCGCCGTGGSVLLRWTAGSPITAGWPGWGSRRHPDGGGAG